MEFSDRHLSCLKALASARALVVNHSTSDETISQILETLVQSLQDDQVHLHHHILKLLSDLALHRDLSQVILDRVHAYVSIRKDASLLTAKALAVVVTASECLRTLSTPFHELIEYIFFLLCSSPTISVRSWILFNAARFHVPPYCLVVVLLKLTSDPYPYVRRAALDGLASSKELKNVKKCGLIQSCYDRAVELLRDTNGCVRSVAVHVVSEWGNKLATLNSEDGNLDRFDAVFIQLCGMVRDMDVEVRSEAFAAIGDTKLVSEDTLLQTLSKKITKSIKERKISESTTSKEFDLLASNVARVFVHGLEDEFNEVRKSACISLGKLTILSAQFAKDGVNFLMDLLNDDMMAVRLQCLQTMHHMATLDRLEVQQTHMHMFLGTLVDSNTSIRNATREIIRLMKLNDLDIYKMVINDLLTNLESYPEDETDIFNVLFYIGRSHGKFAVSFVMENFQEIEPSCEGELRFDKARVAAILVLATATSLTHEQRICSIPTKVFTYAVPFLGRISHSIKDVISQDTLFAYLSRCSRSTHSPIAEIFRHEKPCISVVQEVPNHNDGELINNVSPLRQLSYGTSENLYQDIPWGPRLIKSCPEYQQKLSFMQKEETNAIILVLRTVAEMWPLIKSGCMDAVQRTLRSCKEELATISMESNGSVGLLAFACQYLQIIRLLGTLWEHFFPQRRFTDSRAGSLDLSLEKLHTNLRRILYGFVGFSLEVELHILEFILLTCVLKLSKAEMCHRPIALKRLRAVISCVERSCEKECTKLSDFASFCKKSSDASYYSFDAKRLLQIFSLKQVVFDEKLKHVKAELDVPGVDSENPLPFVAGLPAAITFQITLHNVSCQGRVWLKMAVEEITQYVFLDSNQVEEHDCIRKFNLSVPFYRTPKAVSFSLKACIGKECPFDEIYFPNGLGGPKRELTFLCNDMEVFFFLRR